jgi:hypothetical protein
MSARTGPAAASRYPPQPQDPRPRHAGSGASPDLTQSQIPSGPWLLVVTPRTTQRRPNKCVSLRLTASLPFGDEGTFMSVTCEYETPLTEMRLDGTALSPLRIRRLGVRIPPSAPDGLDPLGRTGVMRVWS